MGTCIQQDVAALSPAPESNADAVCVAVHIRPLVESELAEGCQPCLTVTPGQPQARFSQILPHQQCADVEQQDLLGGASVILLITMPPCMQHCAAKAVHLPGNAIQRSVS